MKNVPASRVPPYPYITWTTLTQSATDRIIYCSEDGDDGDDGSLANPIETISEGLDRLRDGYADWLLLKKGDEFSGKITTNWRKSGRSVSQKMLIGSYGTGARPIIDCLDDTCFGTNPINWPVETYAHVALIGLEITSSTFNGTTTQSGISILGECHDFLFEDLYIHNVCVGINVQGYPNDARHTGIAVRGCMIEDCYFTAADGNNPLGMFVGNTDGILIEWNTFWNCGWLSEASYTQFRHTLYVEQFCTDATVRYNLAAGTDGLQKRAPGVLLGNVCSRMAMSFSIGNGDTVPAAGINDRVEGNISLEGEAPSGVAVIGLRFCNMSDGTIRLNIIGPSRGTGSDHRAFWGQSQGGSAQICKQVNFSNNIAHNFGGPGLYLDGNASQYDGIVFVRNVFQNPTYQTLEDHGQIVQSGPDLDHTDINSRGNTFVPTPNFSHEVYSDGYTTLALWLTQIGDVGSSGTAVTYRRPQRTLGSYYLEMGGTDDHDAFMDHVIATQSKDTWSHALTAAAVAAYIRAGFK